MSGRPVHLLAAAAIVAAASVASISAASASCFSGCGGYSYAAPAAYYTAPVVYSYSYAAPVSYAAPCASPCGYASYGYAARPMYVVNQGPAYTAPVTGVAEDVYEPGYRRAYPYYDDGGVRWHRRHWHRGYGYRGYRGGYGQRSFGYRQHFGYRHGYRHHGFRHHMRYGMRHPMVGRGGIYRGPRHGMHRMHHGMHRMHMNRMPGVVHPHHMGPK